jgi:hypothetical protein
MASPPAPAAVPAGGLAPRAPARNHNTDELAVPFSTTMLGSYSPYRGMKPLGACFECNRNDGHFALECPTKFARVKGDVPFGLADRRPRTGL